MPTNAGPALPSVDPFEALLKRSQDLRAKGQSGTAITELEAASVSAPTHIKLHERLGSLYQEQGKAQKAFQVFSQLISLQPKNAIYCANLGIAAQGLDQLDIAIHWYRKAIRLSPDYDVAHSNLANCLKLLGQLPAAETHYLRAITLNPGFADAHSNYGNLLKESGRIDEAIHQYSKALQINPSHANAWSNLGGCFKDTNRVTEAIVAYRRALALVPKFSVALSNLVHCLTTICDWSARDALLTPMMDALRERIAAGDVTLSIQPHHALVYPLGDEDHVFIAQAFAMGTERAAQRLERVTPRRVSVPYAKWQPEKERLRVGYMSSDFGNHPLSQLMQHYFGMHNRKRVEVFGYALTPHDGTKARDLIEQGIEHFHDVSQLLTVQLADLIRSHHLHVLVDLNGYTRGARSEVLPLRPAPIQVHYMGFAGTLGAPFIDYLISDEIASPKSSLHLHNEKLAMMPHSYFVSDHRQTYPADFPPQELATRASLGLPEDKFVFACFNQLYKIDSMIFGVWMRLLHRHPHAVLWLLRFPPAAEAFLRRTAEKEHHIPAHRLIFTPVAVEKDKYMRFIHCADLALDTPQYNGHTSSCDVLWAGVPIVTLPRERMAGRVCASLLTALGCPELICNTATEYEQLAGRLASPEAHQELHALRAKIRANRWTAPLFDTQRWLHDVEQLFGVMATRYAQGLPPDHLFAEAPRPPLPEH
eukprot:GGOE01014716.1.p1 GENE.GGOE01014716.1~~GGOE01014716.1.p1  ORF type:complete len:768 (+),score=146.83 GGOE01014716.1:191-2305(+)